ncbi:MAG: Arc family DNA-binding protein [Gammaproteobacteria bacterium]|nr:Arc family DNA-binding protein [Gammaproteobacteria bacterium]
MWTKYPLKTNKKDPVLNVRLPKEIVEDLKARALCLGRSFEMELRLRLIRTLENDVSMDQSDKLLEAIYYTPEDASF